MISASEHVIEPVANGVDERELFGLGHIAQFGKGEVEFSSFGIKNSDDDSPSSSTGMSISASRPESVTWSSTAEVPGSCAATGPARPTTSTTTPRRQPRVCARAL